MLVYGSTIHMPFILDTSCRTQAWHFSISADSRETKDVNHGIFALPVMYRKRQENQILVCYYTMMFHARKDRLEISTLWTPGLNDIASIE